MAEHVIHRGDYIQISAEFVGGILDVERGQSQSFASLCAPAEPAKKKHASGPVKARATNIKRAKK